MEKKKLTNKVIAAVAVSLSILTKQKLPCSVALGINKKSTAEACLKYFEKLDALKDKYCSLEESEVGYKVKISAALKPTLKLNYDDFDAGDKQKEYEAALDKLDQKEVEVDIHEIDLTRMVTDKSGKEVTLLDKIELEYDIEGALMEALLDVIFIT